MGINKQKALGDIGEKIVARYHRSLGMIVEESINPADSVKDLMINNETAEVKTQSLFFKENAFTIKTNQLKKCMSVKHLFFVEAPSNYREDPDAGWVYSVDNSIVVYRAHKTKDGRDMILFPKDQPAIKKLFQITDPEELSWMKKWSSSG